MPIRIILAERFSFVASILVGIVAFWGLTLSAFGQTTAVSALDVLDAMREAYNAFPPHTMTVAKHRTFQTIDPKGERSAPKFSEYLLEFHRDGARFDGTRTTSNVDAEGKKSKAEVEQLVWDGEWFLRHYSHRRGSGDKKPIIHRSSDEQNANHALFQGSLYALELNAFLPVDHQPVYETLRPYATNLSVGKNTVGNLLTIEGTTPCGYYKLWVDAENNYILRKALVQKGPDSHWGDDTLSKFGLVSIRYTFDAVLVETIDGLPVVTKAQYRYEIKTIEGKTRLDWGTFAVSKAALHPNFEALGAFRLRNVRDGTRVNDLDGFGITCKWIGGQIVPWIDDELVNAVDTSIDMAKQDPPIESGISSSQTRRSASSLANESAPPEEFPPDRNRAYAPILLVVVVCTLFFASALFLLIRRRTG